MKHGIHTIGVSVLVKLFIDYSGGYCSNGDGLELDQKYIKKFATLCDYKTISGWIVE
jgi:hypothetical protein